jgi:hypothetical protein
VTAAFQAAIARLVTDKAFRDRVVVGDEDLDLSSSEQEHLRVLAGHGGIAVTAKLVASFRLGKLLALLPATRAALGNERFADEALAFWAEHAPISFYAPDEVLAFCAYLRPRLDDHVLPVLASEAARIEQQRPHEDAVTDGVPAPSP